MNGSFELIDYLIFGLYAVTILSIGLWVSRDKKGKQKNAEDYFLASKSLPWWAVGASLIAANISAEQFIGMSGSGFALGLAIASYEWMAAITLLVVGKYFLPKLNKNRISKFASLSARVGSISDNFLGGWYSYRASKSALNMIIKNFSIEINRTNKNSIIFGLHPGTVTSKLSDPFKNKNKNYFSPETSADYLYNVIETKTKNDSGKIFDWNNQEILP